MEVTIRKSKDNQWGFVETFNVYRYLECGSVTVTVVVTQEGKLATPYVLRGEEFIPAKQIEEELGLEKYIKAKKPFYCNLADGFIVSIKAGVNYVTGEFLPDTSNYIVYSLSEKSNMTTNSGVLHLKRVLNIPEQIDTLMMKLSKEVASCLGDRYNYLKSRIE